MPTNLIHPDDAALRAEPVVALATLVGATGSTSKKLGAKMIVGASGRLIGGVTIGGCVDAQVIEAADALVAGTADRRLLSISLDDDEAWEIGLTCGGTVDVLLQRVRPNDANDPVVAAHRRAAELVERGESAVIVTPIDAGEMHTVGDDDVPDAAAGEGGRVFLDRIAPPMTLVIVGAGHIAMSLTTLARELDMRTVIVDGRGRYATRERFPFADEIRVGMPSEIVATIRPTARVAVVLVAHDYKYDLPVLRALLRSPVGYIGMLGSKKRGAAVRDMLRGEGYTEDELARVHSPIGLDLGGRAPAEVALSILAEIVAVRCGKRA
jgi:xanthine dehydrogenase accessory factor